MVRQCDSVKSDMGESFDGSVTCCGYTVDMQENTEFLIELGKAHAFRSELLDGFSELEIWVSSNAANGKASGACLGQKLNALIQDGDKVSKKLAKDILDILPQRNAIIHSRIEILQAGDGPRWCFHLSLPSNLPTAFLMPEQDVEQLRRRLRQLSHRCHQSASAKAATATTATAPAAAAATSASAS